MSASTIDNDQIAKAQAEMARIEARQKRRAKQESEDNDGRKLRIGFCGRCSIAC